jgi:hypothetical protein
MNCGLVHSLKQLWHDEHGFLFGSEFVLLMVIVVFGTIVGLVTLRNSIVQEFADLGNAVGGIDTSFSFAGATLANGTVAGSMFNDLSEFCDPSFNDDSPPTFTNVGVMVIASPEGGN